VRSRELPSVKGRWNRKKGRGCEKKKFVYPLPEEKRKRRGGAGDHWRNPGRRKDLQREKKGVMERSQTAFLVSKQRGKRKRKEEDSTLTKGNNRCRRGNENRGGGEAVGREKWKGVYGKGKRE